MPQKGYHSETEEHNFRAMVRKALTEHQDEKRRFPHKTEKAIAPLNQIRGLGVKTSLL